MSCWSGDPNAGVTTCQNGACRGNDPQRCPPPTPCYLEGETDPVTGLCVNPPAPAGTPCGIDAMCYGGFFQPADMCDGNGFCIGGGSQTRSCAPYVCGVGACTTSCASDADCAAGAHCGDGHCLPAADLGQPCDEDSDCQSNICSGGVCCNQRCDDPCETCSVETGGFCSPAVCDDGLSCTSGFCDAATGECRYVVNDGACLIDDVCYQAGDYNPETACYRCTPDQHTNDWTPVGCVWELPCIINVCKRGGDCEYAIKPDSCLIDNVCYADGDLKPGSDCEVCNRGVHPVDWSPGGCDHSAFCVNGACATSVSGALSADDPTDYCGSQPEHHYALHKVSHQGGPLILRVQSDDGDGLPLVTFFPASHTDYICVGRSAEFTEACNDGSIAGAENLAPGVYTVMVSERAAALGAYTLRIDDDSVC
jgi:hypothetical protein